MRFVGTVLLILSATAPAFADQISEPGQGVTLTYDSNMWEARLDQNDIVLSCFVVGCGSDCDVVLTKTPSGLTAHEFFDQYRNEINKNTIAAASDSAPVVVDKPRMITIDGKQFSMSTVSFKFKPFNAHMRRWMVVEEAPFGVVTLTCNGGEEEYEAAKASWLDLAKTIVIPKN